MNNYILYISLCIKASMQIIYYTFMHTYIHIHLHTYIHIVNEFTNNNNNKLIKEQKHTCCKVVYDIDLVVCYELIL